MELEPTPRPRAALSVDLDGVQTHLAGYGMTPRSDDGLIGIAVERLVERFARYRVKATFFVVARDVRTRPAWLRELVSAGHEIGSHSATHPIGISRLDGPALRSELAGSKRSIEDAVSMPVHGFRAPNWDVSPRVLGAACDAGYAYDASLLATPLLVPARVLLAAKARSPSLLFAMRPWPSSLRRLPHRVRTRWGAITEIPVSVTPRSRWPVYHTLRYDTSDARFDALLAGFVTRGEPLSYALHAIDSVGVADDAIDERLSRHPGGGVGRSDKLALLDRTLDALTTGFACGTLGALAASLSTSERAA